MKFVHHHTGEWIRSDCNTSAQRTESYIAEYDSLESIQNKWLKETFEWMLEIGEPVTQCGSDTFQIRG
jgi:hypothetical protein